MGKQSIEPRYPEAFVHVVAIFALTLCQLKKVVGNPLDFCSFPLYPSPKAGPREETRLGQPRRLRATERD